MNAEEIFKKGIGTLEKQSNSIKPSKVTITAIEMKTKRKDGTEMEVPLLEVVVKHPDRDEPMHISKVKQLVGEKVSCNSLWVVTDDHGNIQKDMPISNLMKHLNITALEQAVGKDIDTVYESESSHYLVLKAY